MISTLPPEHGKDGSLEPPSRILPYGEWPSPISVSDVARGTQRLASLLVAGDTLWWTEGRPAEQGRNALCRVAIVPGGAGAGGEAGIGAPPGPPPAAAWVLPAPWNVRSRVHEYGGGTLAGDGARLWFCHDGDAGIYELDAGAPDAAPAPLLVQPGCRFADLQWCAARGSLLAVSEDHRSAGTEPVNRLVEVLVEGPARGQLRVLAEGADFYSNPAPSPDGQGLAWLSWNHPGMPWDGTTLWYAPWQGDTLGGAVQLAGGPEESVFQPSWSPAGELHLVSDRTGWWNLYRLPPFRVADLRAAVLQPLCALQAEFGQPQWEFGMRCYGFDGQGGIIATARAGGIAQLGRIPAEGGRFTPIALEFEDFRGLQVVGDRAWCMAGGPLAPETLIEIDLAQGRVSEPLGRRPSMLPPAAVSRPETICYPGSGKVATHAFFYPPHHPEIRGPDDERPPLIVINHGGPTSATSSTLRLAVQFWTTRGFAVLDVNYGGSSGYGRAYRARLDAQWGVVDVEDAVAGVRWLADHDRIDAARAAIRGSSAGGFTTLAALTFHRVFRAGVSLYGIGDLSLLASDTHKFESRYLDRLVAPWPAGEAIYRERSPLGHVAQMDSALLLLQGTEDKVVPPNQAEAMFEAVRSKGRPVACLMFPGEQHGFRRAETVERALAAELYFYGRVFGFTPADPLEPVPIANLA